MREVEVGILLKSQSLLRGVELVIFPSLTDVFLNVTSSGGGGGGREPWEIFELGGRSRVRQRHETCQKSMKILNLIILGR